MLRAIGRLRWLPVPAAGVFAALLAAWGGRVADYLSWNNSELAAIFVLSESLQVGADSGDLVFGTYASYTTVGINLATGWLPGHRDVWEAWPIVLSLVGVALLAWGAWTLAGRWAGLTAGAVGVAASPPVLETFVAQANHGPAYFTACLLGALLVLLATRPPTCRWVLAAAAGTGLIAGANLASDLLLLVGGVLPFLGAAILVAARRPGRDTRLMLAVAGGTTALTLVSAWALTALMNAIGLSASGTVLGQPLSFEAREDLAGDAGHVLANLALLGNGRFLSQPVGLESVVGLALAGAGLLAIGILVACLWRVLRARPDTGAAPVGRDLWIAYWGMTAVAVVGVVWILYLPAPGAASGRYLTPIFLAAAAILPVWAAGRGVREVAVGVVATVFCAMSIVGLHDLATGPKSVAQSDGETLLAELQRRGLDRGYAGYWSALGLDWHGGDAVRVLPVSTCGEGPGATLCAFPLNRIISQYEPRPGERTFVVHSPFVSLGQIDPVPARLGAPVDVFQAGTLVVYVFEDDVAARFGPPIRY